MPDLLERLTDAMAERYAIESEVGSGGMATVFVAEDLKHKRKVAIKVLHPELSSVVGGDRFLAEIETVASLSHPHLLSLYESGQADGLLYYVMPFVEGESLRQRIDRERQLPVPEATRLAAEVADGLDYAHRHGVIHRDVKPGNILLSDGHAVLADFGIARAINVAREERLTGTGMAVGTPLYASPEQAAGEDTLDGRSDIYSLGCVLYEMLTGEVPLTGATPQSIHAKRLSQSPTPLTVLRETASFELEDAVARSLAKLPVDRWATAGDFKQALDSTLTAATPAASAGRPMSRVANRGSVQEAKPRHRRRAAAWSLVAVLLALAGGYLWWSGVDRTEAADGFEAHREYRRAQAAYESLQFDSAQVYLLRSIEADSTYARAWALLGYTNVMLNLENTGQAEFLLPAALEAARRAIELDSTLAAAWHTYATVEWSYLRDWTSAERDYRRALDLSSGGSSVSQIAQIRFNLAGLLADLGQCDDARDVIAPYADQPPLERARGSEWAILVPYLCGDYSAAIGEAERSVVAGDSSFTVLHLLFLARVEAGDMEAAELDLEGLRRAWPDRSYASRALQGLLEARQGNLAGARSIIADLEQVEPTLAFEGLDRAPAEPRAQLYASVGDAETAFSILLEEMDVIRAAAG